MIPSKNMAYILSDMNQTELNIKHNYLYNN